MPSPEAVEEYNDAFMYDSDEDVEGLPPTHQVRRSDTFAPTQSTRYQAERHHNGGIGITKKQFNQRTVAYGECLQRAIDASYYNDNLMTSAQTHDDLFAKAEPMEADEKPAADSETNNGTADHSVPAYAQGRSGEM